MNDTIYRRDAIQAVWKPQVKPNELIFDALKTAIESEINNVPSAHSLQGEWIPTSERLPEEMGRYLVSYIWVDHVSVEVMAYIKGNFYSPRCEYADETCDTVIAWMELPKPYKGANK